jgi:Carbohydrate family 9 binding domain-like
LTDPNRLLANLGPMVEKMPEDQGARALHSVGSHFARSGQWMLARETFLVMVDRYPTHPLSIDAYRWLLRHGSSSEARRRHELGQFLIVSQTQFGVVNKNETVTISREAPFGGPVGPNPNLKPKSPIKLPVYEDHRQVTGVHLSDKNEYRKWYQGAIDIEPKLAAFGPLLVNDPSVQFALQAARRKMGDFDTAAKWYADFVSRQSEGPWYDAAASELWLDKRVGLPPKPVATCRFVETRPFLDGKLDDDCWQGGQPLKLRNATGTTAEEFPTEVRIAYDKDYIFLAVRCAHPAGQQMEPAKERGHDADLRAYDRVSLMLDLDRDYSTCFHLQVDQRGCVYDDCWGDKSWDPRWFVKVHDDEKEWIVEAAIPLTALTGDGISQGQAWAFNVVRVLPGKGVQAFSLPAEAPEEALRPEGMGLLLFTQNTRTSSVKPMSRPSDAP